MSDNPKRAIRLLVNEQDYASLVSMGVVTKEDEIEGICESLRTYWHQGGIFVRWDVSFRGQTRWSEAKRGPQPDGTTMDVMSNGPEMTAELRRTR